MKRKAFKAFLMRGEWFREGIGSFFYWFAFYRLVFWGVLFILVDLLARVSIKTKSRRNRFGGTLFHFYLNVAT